LGSFSKLSFNDGKFHCILLNGQSALNRLFDRAAVSGSADRTRLLANFDRLFPGAKLTIVDTKTEQKTQAEALLSLLSRPGLPTVLSTKWITQQMRTPWRQVTQHLSADVNRAIENLGWRYVSRKGRLGSTFERIAPMSVMAGLKALSSPSSRTATLLPPMPAPRTTTIILQSASEATMAM